MTVGSDNIMAGEHEHTLSDWQNRIDIAVKSAVNIAFHERDCDKDCRIVAVVNQKVDDNKDLLVEVRADVKDNTKLTASLLWTTVFSLAGIVFTLILLLLGIK